MTPPRLFTQDCSLHETIFISFKEWFAPLRPASVSWFSVGFSLITQACLPIKSFSPWGEDCLFERFALGLRQTQLALLMFHPNKFAVKGNQLFKSPTSSLQVYNWSFQSGLLYASFQWLKSLDRSFCSRSGRLSLDLQVCNWSFESGSLCFSTPCFWLVSYVRSASYLRVYDDVKSREVPFGSLQSLKLKWALFLDSKMFRTNSIRNVAREFSFWVVSPSHGD